MAYIHCHKCGWSQDDFWEWDWTGIKRFWKWSYRPFGYNPVSLILEDIASYWKPHYIEYDKWIAKERGYKSAEVHSWRVMVSSIRTHARRLFTQRWWTYRSWKRDNTLRMANCPKCGDSENLDID